MGGDDLGACERLSDTRIAGMECSIRYASGAIVTLVFHSLQAHCVACSCSVTCLWRA